jgi:integrase
VSETHSLMDGKVHVYRRENSRFWQCAVYLSGKNHRQTTGQSNLAYAIEFARDWYLDRVAEDRLSRKGMMPAAAPIPITAPVPPRTRFPGEKTFRIAAAAFVREFQTMTEGERNAEYVASKERILRIHILPFLGDLPLSAVTAGRIQEYRLHRLTPPERLEPARYNINGREVIGRPKKWKRPTRSTLHAEIVCLRQVLKTANRHGWLASMPDMSAPYKSSGKISHRAWFSPEEYKRFYEATRQRARKPKKERWRAECEQFHDWVLFMVNTGLRPDEASRLEFRDVTIVFDEDTGQRILEIEVRGKRGVGYCKSMPGAVLPFERIVKRKNPKPAELIFGAVQRELFNAVLDELDLKKDRDGKPRTAYSLRHTYICLRLMEGADIYQVAKNCRTSVEMIEKYYAAHIKNTLDAAAINVRKPLKERKGPSANRSPANAER